MTFIELGTIKAAKHVMSAQPTANNLHRNDVKQAFSVFRLRLWTRTPTQDVFTTEKSCCTPRRLISSTQRHRKHLANSFPSCCHPEANKSPLPVSVISRDSATVYLPAACLQPGDASGYSWELWRRFHLSADFLNSHRVNTLQAVYVGVLRNRAREGFLRDRMLVSQSCVYL